MPSKNILLKFQNYLWFNFFVQELLISLKRMNALEIAELTNENLRREAHRLCYYMDAYVNSFTKHYSHLGELLGILNNLLEFYEELDRQPGPTAAQMKDRLTHLIGLVRMRMYYANKIMNATEEYNHEVLNVPVF